LGRLKGLTSNDFGCATYSTVDLPDDPWAAVFSRENGLNLLRVPSYVHTPEGIGSGSTVAEVLATYPDANEYRNGFVASVPGYTDRAYDIWTDDPGSPDAKVTQLGIYTYVSC
jgi:hypothetical protein